MQLPQTVEVKEIRVLTSKQIAEEYGTTPGVIKKNFSNNRERFVEGKHYISLTGDELRAFKNQVNNVHLVANRTSHLYLWTEKGALLHAKSLNTDKAWQVYDYLVDFYFRAKEKQPEKKITVPVPVKAEPLKSDVDNKAVDQDEISILKILLQVAEQKGLSVKTRNLKTVNSYLKGEHLAIRSGMTLKQVNYELAFELFHAVVNSDCGNMIKSPLRSYYDTQAERAANLIIQLLDVKTA